MEETGEWAGGSGGAGFLRQAEEESFAPGFDRFFEGDGHPHRVGGDGDGGIDQHRIGTEFECFGRVAGGTESGIDDHRDSRLIDDDGDLITGGETAVATDRGTERHHGGSADFLKAFGEHRIGIDVGEHGESLFDEDFSGLEGFDRVGEQVGGVGVDFELHPFGESGGGGEAGQADGFLSIDRSTGVGEDQELLGIDKFENVGVGVVAAGEIRAAKGNGDDLAASGGQRIAHGIIGWKFSSANQESGGKFAAGDDERVGHARSGQGNREVSKFQNRESREFDD